MLAAELAEPAQSGRLNVGEILGLKLCTLQNISFFMWLTATARAEIRKGSFMEWKQDFLERFNYNDNA